MSEWQPIETAPKDGTAILIYIGGLDRSRVRVVAWFGPWGSWLPPGVEVDAKHDERWGVGSGMPTHWQSLPEPPK